MRTSKSIRRFITSLLTAGFIFSSVVPLTASPILNDTPSVLAFARSADGQIRMLKGTTGALTIQRTGQSLATDVANQYAPIFGIRNPGTELSVKHSKLRKNSRHNIRYQQTYNGIPVIAGELVANLNSQQQLTSISGETAQINLAVVTPTVSAEQAKQTALYATSVWHETEDKELVATEPTLQIYVPALIGPGDGPERLVWQLKVKPKGIVRFNEYILVDAENGNIALHFNTIHTALGREVYTAALEADLPGTLVCSETDQNCNGNVDADFAMNYVADTYNYYLNNHGRDSFDNAGATIISSVNLLESQYNNSPNAFWTGTQAVFTDGMTAGDDVVAHEITHAVTQHTSALFYFYQSGAINESLSDLWGEVVDLTNNAGNDDPSVRWQMGEDASIGTIRNMSNPGDFGDPDRMSSPNYYTGELDNGGVHTNSGVNNKAATLMIDGGTFNGQTISAIGIDKTLTLYYDVQTNYLTSGSDYLDLYNALNQSCQTLVGTNGITTNDCTQVNNALLAVEMNQDPAVDYNPEAALCPGDTPANTLFFDDMETINMNWGPQTNIGVNPWTYLRGVAKSGDNSLAALPQSGMSIDSYLVQANPINFSNTNRAYFLHFSHAFDMDYDGVSGTNKDGGVIEYSTNGGVIWTDAGFMIESGRDYNGAITSTSNPGLTRNAFVRTSHGFNSTRLRLSNLVGQDVQIGFRFFADNTIDSFLWSIDNVRIYTCGSVPVAEAGPNQTVDINQAVNLSGSGSDIDGAITYQWSQTGGENVILSNTAIASPNFTSPSSAQTLVFQLTTTDTDGNTAIDTVSINVQDPDAVGGTNPPANDGGSGCTLSDQGRFDPVWIVLLSLLSLLHLSLHRRQLKLRSRL